MGPVPATMVGGHAEEAERLVRGEPPVTKAAEPWDLWDETRTTAERYADERADARWLAEQAAEWARAALYEIGHSPTLVTQYAESARSLALASLAKMQAYGAER